MHSLEYPRRVPIDHKPPGEIEESVPVTLKVGDLVVWNVSKKEDVSLNYHYTKMGAGIVLTTCWALFNWARYSSPSNPIDGKYIPEATILWSNGMTTNSSHNAVRRVSK